MTSTYRMLRLARRPDGIPAADDFALTTETVPTPGPGQVLIANSAMSVDPLMRARMEPETGIAHVPPFVIGEPLDGSAVGRVVASRSPRFAEGDLVVNNGAWQEMYLCDAGTGGWFDPRRLEVSADVEDHHLLGVLGVSGLTAYVGLTRIARLAPGDVVYVSAAGGAVGGIAVQLALAWGHRVVASAGGPEKVRRIGERYATKGADLRVIDYRSGDLSDQLASAAPDGVDVYFDNVGGDHLEAALEHLLPGGRVALCGHVASVGGATSGVSNLSRAIYRGLRLEGFMVRHHHDAWDGYVALAQQLMADARLSLPTTRYDGLESAPRAMADLLSGQTDGKVHVRLDPPSHN